MNKPKGGFTLLEAVIALAVWMVLAAGVSSVWLHVSRTSTQVITTQNAFENARASMDALLVNLQMADTIRLETDRHHVLRRLTLTQRDPNGNPHDYIFYFSANARPGEAKYHRLEFGLNNEFASRIALVKLEQTGQNRMRVTVITDDEAALTLTGSADIRYKDVTVTQNP
jgi:type II secretory pathway component PulJ